MALTLDERTIRRAIFGASAAIALLGLIVEILHYTVDTSGSVLLPFFSLSVEANLPTFYAALLLAGCGVLLLLVGAGAAQTGAPFRRRWKALGAVFLYLSLDEAVELHEHLGKLLQFGGVLYYSWVVPAGVLVLALGLLYLPLLRHLPQKTRRRFVLAGVLYVGGALALELPLGWWAERAGTENLRYALLDWVEESLELAGSSLFLVSLLSHLRERHGELRVT